MFIADLTIATVRLLTRASTVSSHRVITVPYDDIIREGTFGSAFPSVGHPLVTVWSHDDVYRVSAYGWSYCGPVSVFWEAPSDLLLV